MKQQQRLAALAHFAPIFLNPNFRFAIWEQPAPDESGVLLVPYRTLSPGAAEFRRACQTFGWAQTVNWRHWMQTETAKSLMQSPEHVAEASSEELGKMLTAFIRGDRFMEGTLNAAFERGFLTAIAQRAEALLSGHDGPEDQPVL